MKMRFLFVCGGTAGHINPALAVAGKLKSMFPDAGFLFVGSGRALEKRLVPAAGYELENIHMTGFTRGISLRALRENAVTAKNLVLSRHDSKRIIKEFRPSIVIGMGGYVCYPVLKEAHAMGIPTVMHESNAVPGLTTKLLSGTVDRVMVAFRDVEHLYKKPERVIMTGTPVRQDFWLKTKEEARRSLGLDDRPLAVSFWGSLGASHMNEIMADFIALNVKTGALQQIHSTGGGDAGREKLLANLKARGVDNLPGYVDIRPYIDDMGLVMTAADVVLCRAGASTLAELTAMGKPSVLVPSPNVTDNHQEKNARALENSGAAKVITEDNCTGQSLYDAVTAMLSGGALEEMSRSALAAGVKDADERIVKTILSLIDD